MSACRIFMRQHNQVRKLAVFRVLTQGQLLRAHSRHHRKLLSSVPAGLDLVRPLGHRREIHLGREVGHGLCEVTIRGGRVEGGGEWSGNGGGEGEENGIAAHRMDERGRCEEEKRCCR